MYGFNPNADQVDDINRLVYESGQNEATVLRKLIDEALAARRRKAADDELAGAGADQISIADRLAGIEHFLIRSLQQSDTSYRMLDIILALTQDSLAESRAHRKRTWNQLVPSLKERGLSTKDIARKFEEETDEGKDFAYGVARDLKKEQDENSSPRRARR